MILVLRTQPGTDVRVTVAEIVVHVHVTHASVRPVVQVATAVNEAGRPDVRTPVSFEGEKTFFFLRFRFDGFCFNGGAALPPPRTFSVFGSGAEQART